MLLDAVRYADDAHFITQDPEKNEQLKWHQTHVTTGEP